MAGMTIAEAWPAVSRPFTVYDLDQMPDDGRRYELVDGILIVSPAPSVAHQLVTMAVAVELEGARPKGVRVLPGPEVIVFELRDGRYEQVAHVAGDEPFAASKPFSAEVIPSRLVAGLLPD